MKLFSAYDYRQLRVYNYLIYSSYLNKRGFFGTIFYICNIFFVDIVEKYKRDDTPGRSRYHFAMFLYSLHVPNLIKNFKSLIFTNKKFVQRLSFPANYYHRFSFFYNDETRRLPKQYFPHHNITETNFFRTNEIPNIQF